MRLNCSKGVSPHSREIEIDKARLAFENRSFTFLEVDLRVLFWYIRTQPQAAAVGSKRHILRTRSVRRGMLRVHRDPGEYRRGTRWG